MSFEGIVAVSTVGSLLLGILIGLLLGLAAFLICYCRQRHVQRSKHYSHSSQSRAATTATAVRTASQPVVSSRETIARQLQEESYDDVVLPPRGRQDAVPPPITPRGQVDGLELKQNVAYGTLSS